MVISAIGDPRTKGVYTTFSATAPQLHFDLDRDRLQILGVDVDALFRAM